MIASGDHLARNAFRVGLREEPSRPNLTQELDPADILEVQDVAQAIARAEQLAREPVANAPSLDVFDRLVAGGARGARRTDDVSGSALHARVTPTPLPPPPVNLASVILNVPARSTSHEDDAFYQPAGRIRALADGTLEIHRPEPTLMMRIRQRRGKLSWLVAGIVAPFVVLAGVGTWMGATEPTPSIAVKPLHVVHAPVRVTRAALAAPSSAPSAGQTAGQPALARTFDVNSLPTAKTR